MYEKAQALYQPQEVSDFVYARHVVAAVEATWQIFRLLYGRDVGASSMCRTGCFFHMYQESGQTKVKRIIACDHTMVDHLACLCGACREFLMELHPYNRNLGVYGWLRNTSNHHFGRIVTTVVGEAQQFEEKSHIRLKVYRKSQNFSHVKCEDLFFEINFRKSEFTLN